MVPDDFQQLLAKLHSEFETLHLENVMLKKELQNMHVLKKAFEPRSPNGQSIHTKRRHIRSPREEAASKNRAIPIGVASWSHAPGIRPQSAPDIADVTADFEICSPPAPETAHDPGWDDMSNEIVYLDSAQSPHGRTAEIETVIATNSKKVSYASSSFYSDDSTEPDPTPNHRLSASRETAIGYLKSDTSYRRPSFRVASRDSSYFSLYLAAFVLLDCGMILWNCNYDEFKGPPVAFHVLTAITTTFFIIDGAVRSHKLCSFKSLHPVRDVFDALCLAVMLFDQICLITRGSSFRVAWASVVRSFRVLRLFYVLRDGVKSGGASYLLREFDWLLSALMSTAGWRTVLCVLFYIGMLFTVCSIALTDGSLHHQCASSDLDGDPLCEYFGSLRNSYMTLFKVTYGGILWGDILDSLGNLSTFYGVLFGLFIFSHAILLVNIGIGAILRICQESTDQQNYLDALRKEAGRQEKDIRLIEQLFLEIDTNDNGAITRAEFEVAMRDPHLTSAFAALQLHIFDLHAIFPLFDINGSGDISLHEFVLGCMKMKGSARSLDVIHLQASVNQISDQLATLTTKASETVDERDVNEKIRGSGRIKPLPSLSITNVDTSMKIIKATTDELERTFARKQQSIKRCELRAMSLQELRLIPDMIKDSLRHETWVNLQSREKLAIENVNLYQFNYYFMYAKTAPHGVILDGLIASTFDAGHDLVQYDSDAADAKPIAKAVVLEKLANGSVHAAVVHGNFKTNSHPVQSQGRNCGPLAQLHAPGAISFKEYMSSESLQPRWFCSHWWGESVVQFVRCCDEHARRRRLRQSEAAYWVCAYANRQYDLSAEITEDPRASSFFKALDLSEGVLLFLDRKATPFTRIWCCYEIYLTIMSGTKVLDIITVRELRGTAKAVLLSDGKLPCESRMSKYEREIEFPLRLLVYGMRADLAMGEATVPSDKANILSVIKSTVRGSGGMEVSAIDQANGALNAVFAQVAWIHALQGQVDVENVHGLSLPRILSCDTRPRIEFSFEMCPDISNADLRLFAGGLSSSHNDIHLSCGNCKNLSDKVMKDLAAQLPESLKVCRLDFVGCSAITSKGLALLTQGLPQEITNLRLDFACCPEIDMVGVRFLAENLPKSIKKFHATFVGTQVDRNFRSISELQAACGKTMFSRAVNRIGHLTRHPEK